MCMQSSRMGITVVEEEPKTSTMPFTLNSVCLLTSLYIHLNIPIFTKSYPKMTFSCKPFAFDHILLIAFL